jgi:glutamate decarboxylase
MSMTPERDTHATELFGNRFFSEEVPSTRFPGSGMSPSDAMRLVDDDLDSSATRCATSRRS